MLLLVQIRVIIIIIVTTMNTVSDGLKRSMAERHANHSFAKNDKANLFRKEDIFQQKFMEHFETINKTPTSNKQEATVDNQEVKFKKTLIDYSSKSSPIDSITSIDQDAIHIVQSQTPVVVAPPIVPGLKANSLQTIKIIKDMFMGKEQKENNSFDSNSLMVIEYYSQILKDIGRKEIKKEVKLIKNRSLSKSPTYQEIQMKEVQTEEKSGQQEHSKMFQRTSRKDLILMELIREKKRKNFAPDYFPIMEMKLMELLEFILEDQSQYIGLDPHSKVREVLKNLQSFQGKMIEGESKINLLRIFFEEFTTLKKQKDQLQAMKSYTPMKGLENREKTPTSTSGKFKTTKDTFKQPKQTYKDAASKQYGNSSTVKKQTRKEPNINWIENQRYERQQASRPPKPRGRAAEAKKPVNDEWIGSC